MKTRQKILISIFTLIVLVGLFLTFFVERSFVPGAAYTGITGKSVWTLKNPFRENTSNQVDVAKLHLEVTTNKSASAEPIDTFSRHDSECRKASETWSYDDPVPDCIYEALKQNTKDEDKDTKLKTFDLLCEIELSMRDRHKTLVPGSCQVVYWNEKKLGRLKGGQKLPELKTDKN